MSRITGLPAARVIVPSATPPVGPPALLAQLQAPAPTPSRFFQLTAACDLSSVARAGLNAYQDGLGQAGTTRLAYMHCMAAGRRWNRRLYGSEFTSKQYPEYLTVDGVGIARACSPWNDAALARLQAGSWPRRAITDSGVRISGAGSALGLLWLPAIDGFQYVDGHWLPVCAELDPPAVLLDALHSPGDR
jgi:hypothetical protein